MRPSVALPTIANRMTTLVSLGCGRSSISAKAERDRPATLSGRRKTPRWFTISSRRTAKANMKRAIC